MTVLFFNISNNVVSLFIKKKNREKKHSILTFLERFNFCHQFPFCYTSILTNRKKYIQAGLGNSHVAIPNKRFLGMTIEAIVVISLFDLTRKIK